MITDLRTKSTQVHVYVKETNDFSSVPINYLIVGDIFKLPVEEGFIYDNNRNDIIFTCQSKPLKEDSHYHIQVTTDCMVN